MFSGIIEEKQKAVSIQQGKDSLRLTFSTPSSWEVTDGESIALDGVCTTIENLTDATFSVFCMKETLDKTTFSSLSSDHEFNMERCLTLNTLIGGHLVQGHVDTIAKVKTVEKNGDDVSLSFTLPEHFTKYIVYKGSICVNGVSLTVVSVDETSFKVSLIPYTLEHTNLSELRGGDVVNIEVDMIAKYVEKLTR